MAPDKNIEDPEISADSVLVRKVLGGDLRAQEAFAQRMACVPRILRALDGRRGRQLSNQDLEDLSQDTVVKILEKLETFPSYATLEFWAHRFCSLEYMNRVRRLSRARRVSHEDVSRIEAPQQDALKMDAHELQQWLDRLGPPESETIRLRLFQGKDFDAIGTSLGIPSATAKSRYYRGIIWLQERLAKDDEGDQ